VTHATSRRRPRSLLVLLVLLALAAAVAACGGDDGDQPEADDGATEPGPGQEEQDEQSTMEDDDDAGGEAGGEALPDTPVTASLSRAGDFSGGEPDLADLPVQPDEVEAHWYRAGDTYAVVYVGLDPGVDACPGNSIMLSDGSFDFVSNAELPDAACPEFPTRIDNSPTQGVLVCNGVVSYRTLIPTDQIGTLFAGVEAQGDEPGSGSGVYSQAPITDPTDAPEIDPAVLSC